MLLLKDCARCSGDLLVVAVAGEKTATCLQCGFTRILTGTVASYQEERARRFSQPSSPMHAGSDVSLRSRAARGVRRKTA